MNSRLRFSLIDHGSHGSRSSGGWRPFSAQAFNHASSQRSTSMPFIESVPMTEYMIAVNSAPFSLSDPKLSPRPMAGARKILSARLFVRGTCGWAQGSRPPRGSMREC